jgi:hypothetical protein
LRPESIQDETCLAVVAATVLYIIASGTKGFSLAGGFAANGYGTHSPGEYGLAAALVAEVVLTFMFLMIILGATDSRAPAGFAPLAIGLGLTLIHLIGIPVTNLSVNPARSTGPALFVGGWGCSGWRPWSALVWPAWSIRSSAVRRRLHSLLPRASQARQRAPLCRRDLLGETLLKIVSDSTVCLAAIEPTERTCRHPLTQRQIQKTGGAAAGNTAPSEARGAYPTATPL